MGSTLKAKGHTFCFTLVQCTTFTSLPPWCASQADRGTSVYNIHLSAQTLNTVHHSKLSITEKLPSW